MKCQLWQEYLTLGQDYFPTRMVAEVVPNETDYDVNEGQQVKTYFIELFACFSDNATKPILVLETADNVYGPWTALTTLTDSDIGESTATLSRDVSTTAKMYTRWRVTKLDQLTTGQGNDVAFRIRSVAR